MSERLTIELPADVPEEQRNDLVRSLRELSEVERADVLTSRNVDANTITIGMQMATALAPAVDKVVDTIRGRPIKGVKLTFAGGGSLSVDEISGKDLRQLLDQLGH
jgi:hypothetical protein